MHDIQEYIRCRDDIFYFATEYLEADLKGFHIDILKKYIGLETGKTANIIGFRTSNLNTLNATYALWVTMFHDSTEICIVTQSRTYQSSILSIIENLINLFDKNWNSNQKKYEIDSITPHFISFENKSSITIASGNGNSIRGKKFDITIYESLFRNENAYECFFNTAHCGKKNIITNLGLLDEPSVIETYGDVYVYPWYCDVNLTLEWYIKKLNILGKTIFDLDYGCTRGFSNGEHRFR